MAADNNANDNDNNHANAASDEQPQELVDRLLTDAGTDVQLQHLVLPWVPPRKVELLCTLLKAGGLPCLRSLELVLPYKHSSLGEPLAVALEARQARGLSPIERLAGVGSLDAASLRRLWACCPATETAHLEAEGATRLTALNSHIKECNASCGSGFPALRSLRFHGVGHVISDRVQHGSTVLVKQALDALLRQPLVLLEEVALSECAPAAGLLSSLGKALAQGQLPALSSLTLSESKLHADDMKALVGGLATTTGTRLRRLALPNLYVCAADVMELAKALKTAPPAAGGALSALEELHLSLKGARWDGLLQALSEEGAQRAPCAATLRVLDVDGDEVTEAGVRPFLRRLGDGGFPTLTKLTVHGGGMSCEMLQLLAQALLSLAQRHTPARLEQLTVQHATLHLGCLDALTPVFAAGGLPLLTTLEIKGVGRVDNTDTNPIRFLDEWTALGPKIKLQVLGLGPPMPTALTPRFLEALGDCGFCPSLRGLTNIPGNVRNQEAEAALMDRWQAQQDLAAEAAAAVKQDVEARAKAEADEAEAKEAEAKAKAAEAKAAKAAGATAAAADGEEDDEDEGSDGMEGDEDGEGEASSSSDEEDSEDEAAEEGENMDEA